MADRGSNEKKAGFNWYPGHMTKAKRKMQEDIKLVDIILDIRDARAPLSSTNPDLKQMCGNKERIILLNKSDLSDKRVNDMWISRYADEGIRVICIDARQKGYLKDIRCLIDERSAEKRARDLKRGIKNRQIKVMAAGIPNVGKSTIINTFAGGRRAKTGDKPGVTRGDQWISLGKDILLLDTPGILWPKFDDERTAMNLCLIGSVRDEIADPEDIFGYFYGVLCQMYPEALNDRYDLGTCSSWDEALTKIAINRHCLKAGGDPDTARAARMVIEDFRSGALGRITLEHD